MNIKNIISLLLICIFCFSCTPTEKPTTDINKPANMNLEIESKYPPELTAIVTLKLEGETLPGTPKVVSANETSSAFFEKMGTSEVIQQVTENIWIAVLKSDESYVIGWISKDNKLFGYCSEPFVAKNGLDVTFSPGMPATLEYDLTKPDEGLKIFPAILLLSRKALQNGKVSMMDFGVSERIEEPKVVKIEGLAQGTYQLWAQDLEAEDFVASRTRFLYDKRLIDIKPGEVKKVQAQYPLEDTTVEDGDITINGLTYNSEGEILANEKIKLIPINDEGQRFDLYYPDTVSDSEGKFQFTGVRPNINVLIKSENGSINLPENYLTKGSTLWLDFLLGKINERIYVKYAIPDIKVIGKDGQPSSILDLFGKIAVINVWSSWCTASQEALSKFNSLAQEYKDNNDIVFVALSTDYSRKNWEETVSKSGLNALQHYWFDLERNPVALNKPIPYSMIIDKKTIVCTEGINIDIREELKKVIEASKNNEEPQEK